MKRLLLGSLLLLLLFGCHKAQPPLTHAPETKPPVVETVEAETTTPIGETQEPQTAEPVQPTPIPSEPDILAGMSLREKIGQLFIIRPDALDRSISLESLEEPDALGVTSLNPAMAELYHQYPVGGFAIFNKNLVNPEQLAELLTELRAQSSHGLFFGIDEEGGLVSRLANHPAFPVTVFPPMGEIGATGDVNQAYQVGLTIGSYLKTYGFNLDFAPDADVNSNPQNPIIGTRAFSSDPEIAGEMVASAVAGFHDAGMITSIKHFPGHGDTLVDSHVALPVTNKSWDELAQLELIPFERGIAAGTDMVMLGHIQTPNVTGNDLPASLSAQMVQHLRQDLAFEGIIITDSLSMGAIKQTHDSAESTLLAFDAGVDILLMPEDLVASFDAIEQAVMDGRISQTELDHRVRKILELKAKYAIK